jgi:hypothetical protein
MSWPPTAILEDEHEAGRPLLTAIVTHKYGDKEPGNGFYDMARKLGYRFPEPFVFWSAQVQEVFKAHGRPQPSPLIPQTEPLRDR